MISLDSCEDATEPHRLSTEFAATALVPPTLDVLPSALDTTAALTASDTVRLFRVRLRLYFGSGRVAVLLVLGDIP